MKIIAHFSVYGFSNTYLIGPEEGGDAVLIDPGKMDLELLNLIESNGYYIRSILVTHNHDAHIRGIKTLKKIYDAEIFSGGYRIFQFTSNQMMNGDRFETAGLKIDVISIGAYSGDSLIYRVKDALFTGDVLSAGRIGTTPDRHSEEQIRGAIREKILSLPPRTLIFPGHGPVSTVRAESRLNPYFTPEGLMPEGMAEA